MKKHIVIVFIVVLGANFSFAQKDFRFGLKAAPLFCWMKPDFSFGGVPNFTAEGGGGRMGFVWGPMAEFQLNETFLISTGVDINYSSYQLKGTMNDSIGGESIVNWKQRFKTRFIEVPILLKFRTKEIGYIRYFGLFGLGAGVLYSSDSEFSREYSKNTSLISNDDYGKYIKAFRGSMLVGAGAEYTLSGTTALVGSLVFNNGLTNILQKQENQPSSDQFNAVKEKAISNYIQLNIGILF